MVVSSKGYKYIDQDADPATDDRATSSAGYVRLHQNLDAVSTWRFPQAATPMIRDGAFVGGNELGGGRRLCSVYPIAYGPWMVYSHEGVGTVELTVELDAVTWSIGATTIPAGGTDAVNLHCTLCTPGYWEDPPPNLDDWDELVTTTTTRQIKKFEVSARGRRGWVGVVLWVQSELAASPEGAGTLVDVTTTSEAALQVVWTSGSHPNTTTLGTEITERAVVITPAVDPVKGPGSGSMPVRHVERDYRIDATNDHLFLSPPAGDAIHALRGGTTTVEQYEMGVVRIGGVAIQAFTPLRSPAESSFYNHRDCKFMAPAALAREAERLGKERVPTWSAGSTDRNDWWQVLSPVTHSSWVTVRKWLVVNPPGDAGFAGYKLLLGLYIESKSTSGGSGASEIKIQLSDEAPLGSTGTTTNETKDCFIYSRYIATDYLNASWSPIAYNVWGAREHTGPNQWNHRGGLVGTTGPGMTHRADDFRRIQWFQLDFDAASLSYPRCIVADVRRPTNKSDVSVTVIYAGLTTLELT